MKNLSGQLTKQVLALCRARGEERRKKKKEKDKKHGDKIEKIESTLSEYGQDWESSDSSEDDE